MKIMIKGNANSSIEHGSIQDDFVWREVQTKLLRMERVNASFSQVHRRSQREALVQKKPVQDVSAYEA